MYRKVIISVSLNRELIEELYKNVEPGRRSHFIESAIKTALIDGDSKLSRIKKYDSWIMEVVVPLLVERFKGDSYESVRHLFDGTKEDRKHLIDELKLPLTDDGLLMALDNMLLTREKF